MQRVLPLALSVLTALPASVAAQEPDRRPWGRGTLMPSFAVGGSLLLDRPGATVQVVGGLGYYVADNLAVGLSLRNLSRFLGSELESAYPGVKSQIATNEFSVTPGLTVMAHRGRIVSPILGLGAGPIVMNNRLGVIGEVVFTPAMLIRVHPRVALNLGFEVSLRFPRARTRGTYEHPSIDYTVYFPNPLHVGFQVGVAFGPKVGRHRRADPSSAPTTEPTMVTPPADVATSARGPDSPASPATAPAPATPVGPPSGRGLLIGGAVATFAVVPLTLVGLRLTLAGVFSESEDTPAAGLGPPLMIAGVVALVAGGGYAEYCAAPAGTCLPVAEGLSMIEGAAIPETLFTVWSNLFERGFAADGDTVLVHGGTSGIGTMAIALGKLFALTVIVTCGTDAKCRRAEELGADSAINYRSQDFVEAVKQLTGGRGVQVVLDMVGGDYLPRNLACLADDGRHVSIAFQRGAKAEVTIPDVMRRRLTLTGSTLRPRSLEFKTMLADEIARTVWPYVEGGRLKPVIDSVFPLAEAAKAHARMESGEHVGKIVLQVSP